MFTSLLAISACLGLAAAAQVPQIKICGGVDCPSVSRMGMGTLHLVIKHLIHFMFINNMKCNKLGR